MVRISEYQNKLSMDKAIANFDKCLADSKDGSLILGENWGGCVILVKSFEDSNALAALYTDWCISHHRSSWVSYVGEDAVQLFIFDYAAKGSKCMIGVTLPINKSVLKKEKRVQLSFKYAFYGNDQQLGTDIIGHDPKSNLWWLSDKLKDCGGFTLDELEDYLTTNLKK